MRMEGRRLQLTPLGKRHFGGVVALFYAPAVQRHLVAMRGGERLETAMAPSLFAALGPLPSLTATPAPVPLSLQGDWARREVDGAVTMSIGGTLQRRAGPGTPATPRAAVGLHTAATRRQHTATAPLVERRAARDYEFGNILFAGW